MAQEIEHKYLVTDTSYRKLATSVVRIRQGYLSRCPESTVRVRVWGEKGFITIKGENHDAVRSEFEYEIPLSDALQMLEMCEQTPIDKTRYIVPFQGHTWEVDEFHNLPQPLTVAEIELSSEDEHYAPPSFAGQNVTGNSAYYNSNLIPRPTK